MEGLDEWEVLSDGGFLDIHEDDGNYATLSDNLFKNYFRCPSPRHPSSPPPPPLPDCMSVPIHFENPPPTQHQRPEDDEVQEKNIITSQDLMIINPAAEKFDFDDQDPNLELFKVSSPKKQVFFVKKETITEFVDMKLDLESPKSNSKQLSRPSSPTPTQLLVHPHQFQEAPTESDGSSDAQMTIKGVDADDDGRKQSNWDQVDQNHHQGGGGANMNNNIWKWSLTGIGAICSFGVATVCIVVLGGLIKNSGNATTARNSSPNKQDHHHHEDPRHHQKLQFHIYAEDKRSKAVVEHEANKLKEAMSAVRDIPIPLNRAHISFGGYCDASSH